MTNWVTRLSLGQASNHLAVIEVLMLHGHFANDVVLVAVASLRKQCASERTQCTCLEHRRVNQEGSVIQLVTVQNHSVLTIWGD